MDKLYSINRINKSFLSVFVLACFFLNMLYPQLPQKTLPTIIPPPLIKPIFKTLVDSISLSMLKTSDGKIYFKAKVYPANASDTTVTWSVDSLNIATIDSVGKLTVLKYGTLLVTATANDGSGVYCSVTVELVDKPQKDLSRTNPVGANNGPFSIAITNLEDNRLRDVIPTDSTHVDSINNVNALAPNILGSTVDISKNKSGKQTYLTYQPSLDRVLICFGTTVNQWVTVEIFNLMGNLVSKTHEKVQHNNCTEVNTAHLPKGIYLTRVSGQKAILKWVKN